MNFVSGKNPSHTPPPRPSIRKSGAAVSQARKGYQNSIQPHPPHANLSHLRKGQRIIGYIGPKISKAKGLDELKRGNAYLFSLDEDYDIDGSDVTS
jgi:hypothetical protein